jgi:hypothetical protein
MNLYQPLYVDRPQVKPELFVPLRPRTHLQKLAHREEIFRLAGAAEEAAKAVSE